MDYRRWCRFLLVFAPAGLTFSLSADHWQDVLAGSCLGVLAAYFAYRLYYPSLSHALSHQPYAPRIHRLDTSLPTHGHLEENGASHSLERPRSEAEVELLHETGRRDDSVPLDRVWEHGPSVESGRS